MLDGAWERLQLISMRVDTSDRPKSQFSRKCLVSFVNEIALGLVVISSNKLVMFGCVSSSAVNLIINVFIEVTNV